MTFRLLPGIFDVVLLQGRTSWPFVRQGKQECPSCKKRRKTAALSKFENRN